MDADDKEDGVALRAFRGATRLTADDPVEMTEAVEELVSTLLDRNGLAVDDLVSMIFTATPDLVCMFPAAAARGLGLGDVPLICAQEIAVAGEHGRHQLLDRLGHLDRVVGREPRRPAKGTQRHTVLLLVGVHPSDVTTYPCPDSPTSW